MSYTMDNDDWQALLNTSLSPNYDGQDFIPDPTPTYNPTPVYDPATMPSFSPVVGWYWPADPPANIPPIPQHIPVVDMTPTTTAPTSALAPMPTAASTTLAPARTQAKRKYGPGAYLDAQAEGRNSIDADYFASSASRRDGRGDPTTRDSFEASFRLAKGRPSIVQACICPQKQEKKVKRPKNPFILYRMAKSNQIRKALGSGANQQVSAEAGKWWNAESEETKAHYRKLAEIEKRRHAEENQGYKYKPGASTRTKFGDKNCKCGAYELNVARFNEKRGIKRRAPSVEESMEDADLDEAYVPVPTRRPQVPAPTANMMPQPNLNIASLGLPGNQGAQAAAIYAGMKRKASLVISTTRNDSSDEPPRKRRSPRNTASTVNYAEQLADDTFDIDNVDFDNIDFDNIDFDNFDPTTNNDVFDFGAPCRTPSDSAVARIGRSPKDLRSSRNSSMRSNLRNSRDAESPLFMSPAQSTRSQSRAFIDEPSSPLTPIEEVAEKAGARQVSARRSTRSSRGR